MPEDSTMTARMVRPCQPRRPALDRARRGYVDADDRKQAEVGGIRGRLGGSAPTIQQRKPCAVKSGRFRVRCLAAGGEHDLPIREYEDRTPENQGRYHADEMSGVARSAAR